MPDYGLPWVPATNVPLAPYANQAPPVDFSNFYGLRNRDYEKTTTDLGTVVVEPRRRRARSTLRNQVALRRHRPRLDDHRAAVRQQHQHRHPPHRLEVARSDRRASPQSARRHGRFRTGGDRARAGGRPRALARGRREPHAHRDRPGRARHRSLPSQSRRSVHRRPRANGARRRAPRDSVAAYAFDTVKLGDRWELTGGARWDSLRHRLRLGRRDRRRHAVRRGPTTWSAGAAARCSSRGRTAASTRAPAPRSIRRPKGSSLSAATVEPRAGEDAQLRGRHEVGSAAAPAVGQRARLPHREDQRAHAGHQPRRSADGAGRRAAGAGRRGRRRRRLTLALGGLRRLRLHVERDRAPRTRRPSSTTT